MKNKNVILLFLAGLCLIAGSCCKNNDCNEEPKDYRDKWVGNWDFVTKKLIFYQDVTVDYIYYSGEIYKVGDDELMIRYMENDTVWVRVNENGKLSNLRAGNSYDNRGEFIDTDSISIFLRWGGAGHGKHHYINGGKKKGGGK